MPRVSTLQRLPIVGNMWVGKEQSWAIGFYYLIRIVGAVSTQDKTDFEKIPTVVRHGFGLRATEVVQLKYVEVPESFFEVIGHPLKFVAVKVFDAFGLVHGTKL